MFFESIKFKREEKSEWESGYYIGDDENSKKSIIIDSNFQPLPKDNNDISVWNITPNLEYHIVANFPERIN